MVRGSSVQPASFGYTGGLSTEHSADGPTMVRVKVTRGSSSRGFVAEFSEADSPPGYHGRSALAQSCGVSPELTYMGLSLTLHHQPALKPSKALSFLSQARGKNLQGGELLS